MSISGWIGFVPLTYCSCFYLLEETSNQMSPSNTPNTHTHKHTHTQTHTLSLLNPQILRQGGLFLPGEINSSFLRKLILKADAHTSYSTHSGFKQITATTAEPQPPNFVWVQPSHTLRFFETILPHYIPKCTDVFSTCLFSASSLHNIACT